MKRNNHNNKALSKHAVIEALGLRRVTRYSDGVRVWISTTGKEYVSLAEAAKDMPKKDDEK